MFCRVFVYLKFFKMFCQLNNYHDVKLQYNPLNTLRLDFISQLNMAFYWIKPIISVAIDCPDPSHIVRTQKTETAKSDGRHTSNKGSGMTSVQSI